MRRPWLVTRWRHRRRRIWVLPTLMIALSVVLSWWLPWLDRWRSKDPDLGDDWFQFDLGATASLLASVASGVIAFSGFVFTAVTLALQFGTSTFSARLIPVFQRDLVVRVALGVFTSTFVYAVLIAARLGVRETDYKPVVSVLFGVTLAVASVLVFFLLINRIVDLLRVVRLLRRVASYGRYAIDKLYPDPHLDPEVHEIPSPGTSRMMRYGGRSGVLLAVNATGLARIAEQHDLMVTLVPAPGDFLAPGNELLRIDGDVTDLHPGPIHRCLIVGEERTLDNDPGFALRAIVDVANKALSPAVNDPTTAVQAIDYLEELLIRLGNRDLGIGVTADEQGVVRLRMRTPTWEDFVSLATDEIRHYGGDSLQVLRRLRAMLEDVAAAVPPDRRPVLRMRRAAVDAAARAAFPDPPDHGLAMLPDAQGLGSGERAPE